MKPEINTATMQKAALKIAHEVLGLETLTERKRDSLAFHCLSVWGIKEALYAAWSAGSGLPCEAHQFIVCLAQNDLCMVTLETRNMDNLDFYDISVVLLKDALEKAYLYGATSVAAGKRGASHAVKR